MPGQTVVVIGAGLAGLSAANEILKNSPPSTRVILLESQPRVGGRTRSTPLASVDSAILDTGGQWLGPKQKEALALVKRLGLQLVPQYVKGKRIMQLGKNISSYSGLIPNVSVGQILDVQFILILLQLLQVFLFGCCCFCRGLLRWADRTSVEQLCEGWMWTEGGKALVTIVVQAFFGREPGQVSTLAFCRYINANDSVQAMSEMGEGSLQAWTVLGGAQQLSLRLAEEVQAAGGVLQLQRRVVSLEHHSAGGKVLVKHALVPLTGSAGTAAGAAGSDGGGQELPSVKYHWVDTSRRRRGSKDAGGAAAASSTGISLAVADAADNGAGAMPSSGGAASAAAGASPSSSSSSSTSSTAAAAAAAVAAAAPLIHDTAGEASCISSAAPALSSSSASSSPGSSAAAVSSAKETIEADLVIFAAPPPLASRLTFIPPLPPHRQGLLSGSKMGGIIKCLIIYRKAFWREAGYSGEAIVDTTSPAAKEGGAAAAAGGGGGEGGQEAQLLANGPGFNFFDASVPLLEAGSVARVLRTSSSSSSSSSDGSSASFSSSAVPSISRDSTMQHPADEAGIEWVQDERLPGARLLPGLVCFINGDKAQEWAKVDPEARRMAVLRQIQQLFVAGVKKEGKKQDATVSAAAGEEDEASCIALHPIEYIEHNWAADPNTGGCPVASGMGVGVISSFGFRRALSEPCWPVEVLLEEGNATTGGATTGGAAAAAAATASAASASAADDASAEVGSSSNGSGSTTAAQHALPRPYRLLWAGTETADEHCGFMSGALQSGYRAAEQAVQSLRMMRAGGAAGQTGSGRGDTAAVTVPLLAGAAGGAGIGAAATAAAAAAAAGKTPGYGSTTTARSSFTSTSASSGVEGQGAAASSPLLSDV